MYNHPDFGFYYIDGSSKKFYIYTSKKPEQEGGEPIPVTLTNEDLADDSFQFCDGITNTNPINFQNCICCYVKFTTYFTDPLIDRPMTVKEVINEDESNPVQLGVFTVKSDTLSADGKTREIIAYDAMYDIVNKDATNWYNSLEFPISIRTLRASLANEFSLQEAQGSLINDDILIPRQIDENSTINAAAILKCIGEINGVFPHINRFGVLTYIGMDMENPFPSPLYPSSSTFPGSRTFPDKDFNNEIFEVTKNYYKEDSVVWADYTTLKPDAVQIRDEYNEIVYNTNEGATNPYTVINNILCYGLTETQYQTIGYRIFNKIKDFTYTPYQAVFMGNPCLEVGDRIIVRVKDNKKFYSYILTKRIEGIITQFEEVTAPGSLYLNQYTVGNGQLKNLERRVGNIENSGSGPLQIQSVAELPAQPQLNVLYLIQGEYVEVI